MDGRLELALKISSSIDLLPSVAAEAELLVASLQANRGEIPSGVRRL